MQTPTVGHPRYTAEEIVAHAKALYEQKLRTKVEADNKGKYLVIDIETGDYEIDADALSAMKRASAKHPNGALFAMRVGYRAMGSIGAKLKEANV